MITANITRRKLIGQYGTNNLYQERFSYGGTVVGNKTYAKGWQMKTKRLLLVLSAFVLFGYLLGDIHQTPEELVENAVKDCKLGRKNSFLPDSVLAFLRSAFEYTTRIENMPGHGRAEAGYDITTEAYTERNALVEVTIYAHQYDKKQEVAAIHEGIILLELERFWFGWKFGRIVKSEEMKQIY